MTFPSDPQESLELLLEWAEKNINGFDLDLKEGALVLTSMKGVQFLISYHSPTRQLWFASPVSGSHQFQFDVEKKQWIDIRRGISLIECLHQEFFVSSKDSA